MKSTFVGVLLTITFILSACATKAAPASSPQNEAEVPVKVEAILKVQPEADECLACHSDKDRLIETAKPEEVVEKESTGAG